MKGHMKVAVMTKLKKVEIQEKPIPVPKENEALIRVDYVGVCGSDLHYFEHGRIGDFVVETPFVLGHEVAGTVVELGKHVQNLKLGDTVALEPQITCGKCEFCKSGRYNLCRSVEFFATPPIDGVFQEYVAHPAELCFKLADNMDAIEGALIEPLSVGLHATLQGEAKVGQTAVVTGTGCIGLTALLSLKSAGVAKVIVTDHFDKRLAKATELGADGTINSKKVNAVDKILELTEGNGFDIAIETSGSEIAAGQLIEAAKPGATIVLVGYSASGIMTLPIGKALDKEITFKTIFRYRNSYPVAIKAISSGKIKIKNLASHFYDFANIQEALDDAVHKRDEVTKAVIRIAGNAEPCIDR